PSHDTFSRVFRMLDPKAFERCFRQFMAAFAEAANIAPPQGVVALDGKALRNMLAPGNNEALAALQLIELLQLKGCVVTADALHCHRAMAKAIVERGGD